MTSYNRDELLGKTIESFGQYYDKDFLIFVDKDPDPKDYFNSGIAFNRCFIEALRYDPDIIIIQNAECYHAGDILSYAEKNLTDENYISFGCYSLPKESPLPPVIMFNEGASHDGQSAWYNHPIYRPVGYHFCSAITSENLKKINGFDERFKDGKDYEDNYLLFQIRKLGLRIEITSEPFVYHQWHYMKERLGPSNFDLYKELTRSGVYRAVHLINSDL